MTKIDRTINKGRAPKCPKCGSNNTSLKEDDRDEWADLCILCFKCGYDEREIKHNNADTLKAWQKIADNRIKQLNK